MDILDEAIVFATNAHSGQVRKLSKIPYIMHPLEVATIISTLTKDRNTIAAGLLHDTVEDCNIPISEIQSKFGDRITSLVQSETEDKMKDLPANETWKERKDKSLLLLKETNDINVKILWLADKLSNIRSFYREYQKIGDDVWNNTHQKDSKMQGWYYKTIAEYVNELSETDAYKEYVTILNKIFDSQL